MAAEKKERTDTAISAPVPPAPVYAWGVLAALFLVYVNNQWSRSLIFYVVNFSGSATAREFMNVDIGFDQQAYALLASFGFTLLYSACSLFAGRAVDLVSRRLTAVASCVVWSLCTIGTGFAGSFETVLALRVLQGVAQAFTTPAAYTLLQDSFPPEARSTANSIYSSAVYLGGALASLSVLLNSSVGWRESAVLVGVTGLAAAVAALLILREPESAEKPTASSSSSSSSSRQGPKLAAPKQTATINTRPTSATSASAPKPAPKPAAAAAAPQPSSRSLGESLAAVAASRTAVLTMGASALRFCAGYGIGVWSAPFLRGAYPEFEAEYAVVNAFVVAGGGILSSIAGGYISDRYAAQEPRVRAWVPAVGSLLAVPCWMGVVASTDFYHAMGFLLAEYIVAECWFGPTVSVLQSSVPDDVRGTTQGAFGTLTAVGNLLPFAIGALTSNGVPLKDVLFWAIPGAYAASALVFLLAGESLAADAKQKAKAD